MKIEILNLDGALLFSHECENNTVRKTVEAAISAGVNLYRANLAGAELQRAKLHEANFTGANLMGAKLNSAKLAGANFTKADLTDANLRYTIFHARRI